MKTGHVFLFLYLLLIGCRGTQYTKAPSSYSNAYVDFANKKVLVLPIKDINNVLDAEEEEASFIRGLIHCQRIKILDILSLYQYFRFDLTGRSIKESVALLAEHSDVDFVIYTAIAITPDEQRLVVNKSLNATYYDTNSATASIEIYDVADQRLFKKIAYQGKVNDEVLTNMSLRSEKKIEDELLFIEASKKIARRCYKKCRKDFFKTYRCL